MSTVVEGSSSLRLVRPQEPEYIDAERCYLYKGRKFYNSPIEQNNASMQSELCYLRDLVLFYEWRLKGYEAFERGVGEALNSGDGSYRP